MTREDFEKLGDLHKSYESRTESTLLPGKWYSRSVVTDLELPEYTKMINPVEVFLWCESGFMWASV
jgi:hypothetical protein